MPKLPDQNKPKASGITPTSASQIRSSNDQATEEPRWQQIVRLLQKHPYIEMWFDKMLNDEIRDLSVIPDEILVDLVKLFELRREALKDREKILYPLHFTDNDEEIYLDRERKKSARIHTEFVGAIGVLSLEHQRRKENRTELVTDALMRKFKAAIPELFGPPALEKPNATGEKPKKVKRRRVIWPRAWDTDERSGIYPDAIDV